MICLLIAEHRDFERSLKVLASSLEAFKQCRLSRPGMMYRLSEQGIYLMCLLRGHMSVETQTLYRAADGELHPGEKRCLLDRLAGRPL